MVNNRGVLAYMRYVLLGHPQRGRLNRRHISGIKI